MTGQTLGSVHLAGAAAVVGTVGTVGAAALAFFVLLFVAHQLFAWRRATGDRRQQLKWLLAGAVIAVACAVLNFASLDALTGATQRALDDASDLGIVVLPLSIAIGILRYHLWEIDRLVSRTLSYALLTGVLVSAFAGVVLVTTRVLPFSSPVGVAASTLCAAALFNPLRGRFQRLVDRRFNRSRYDRDATVSRFAGRLRHAMDLGSVTRELLDVVGETLGPAHASIWVATQLSRARRQR